MAESVSIYEANWLISRHGELLGTLKRIDDAPETYRGIAAEELRRLAESGAFAARAREEIFSQGGIAGPDPEMAEALRACGITNYTIWNSESELIGSYECPDLDYADRCKAESEVIRCWGESMRGIMELETDPETGNVLRFRQIFELN